MKLVNFTALELQELLNKKEITSLEVTKDYFNNIEKYKNLNAYITVTEEAAIKEAKAADSRIQSGNKLSEIDGIPLAIKDNFLTKGVKTTNASKFYSEFIPTYESTITQQLKDAGTICLGKTNMDEFAMGSTNTTSYFGAVKNPWTGTDKLDKVPGGSSGGSAAAVAANLAPFALGSDTGGSIRQPAAFCGIVGLKPTYGVCSRYGIFAFASSLDQAGPMSKTVTDNALLLNYMAGYDPKEATMTPFTKPDYVENIKAPVKKFSVGVIKEYETYNINEDVKKAYLNTIKLLEKEGIEVKEVSFPKHNLVIPVYYIIAPVEAASNLARYDGIRYGTREKGDNLVDIYQKSRSSGFGDEVKTRILTGTYNVLSENFHTLINAAKVRSAITKDFSNIFKQVDFILSPTAASTAFQLNSLPINPLDMYYSDVFTGSVNLAGLPAISLPHSLASNGMPVGIQLIGNYYSEVSIYQMSYWLEQQFAFKLKADLLQD